MLFEFIFMVAIGLLIIVLGLIVWKKEKIILIHEYHYRNVKREDYPAYTRLIGIGLIVIGAGPCLAGVFALLMLRVPYLIALFACIACGFIVMHKAQMKYNGSWFS